MKFFKIVFFIFGLSILGWVIQNINIGETFNLINQILYKKTNVAFDEFEKSTNINNDKNFVIAGGVAANKSLRDMFSKLCEERKYKSTFPSINLCGDNGAMIGLVGLAKYKKKKFDNLDFPANPRWQLDQNAKFLKGAGVKL